MRDQYASDISDFLKFSFLRAVTQDDLRLGVAWYYLPGHDGKPDGRHVEYKSQSAWRALDEHVFDHMTGLQEPSVAELEGLPIWPNGSLFHRIPVASRKREVWVQGMVDAMGDADFVFLDPDNGLGRGASKHARIADLVALHRNNRAIAIIKFPGRHKSHIDQIQELHHALESAGFGCSITVNTCVRVANRQKACVPRHRFFTIAGADEKIKVRAEDYARKLNGLPQITRVMAHCVG